MENNQIIVSAEEQFAREVTLGVIVQKPPSVWLTLIPGMFIIDFLRRSRAIRLYTKRFMFPRTLALETGQAILQGQDKAPINSQSEVEIENWLNSLNLYSQDLAQAQKTTVDLLTDHYAKLLRAKGNTYYDLIKNAYKQREDYEEHINRLSAAEREVDRAIIAKLGENEKLRKKFQAEEQQVEMRRKKIIEEVF